MLSSHLLRSAASARLLVEVAADYGISPGSALRGTGLTQHQLQDSQLEIHSSQEQRVIENMVRRLGAGSDAALVAGTRYSLGLFGMIGFACMSSPTMGGVIDVTIRYQDLLFTLARADQVRDGESTRLEIDASGLPGPIKQFVVDHAISTAWTALRDLAGERIPTGRVELTQPCPGYAERYVELLGVRPQFSGSGNYIELDTAFLDRPRLAIDPAALAVCERECRVLLARREADGGTHGLVYDRLSRATGVVPSMTMIASDLNMSVRTARRKLDAEGITFREIEQRVRCERSESLLAETTLTLAEIATLLGYWSESGFARAFHRWHGTTPGRWRAEHLARR